MLAVPGAACLRPVPFSSGRPDGIEVRQPLRRPVVPLGVMVRVVLAVRQADEVAGVVIERVAVDVMDVMAWRDGAVLGLP